MASVDVWAPLRYGWGHVYWATIEGLPVVWCGRDLGKTRPSGYTSTSPTLVVSQSAAIGAQVDRDAGIAAGYPLTLHLLDDDTMSGYMTRPAWQARVVANSASSDTTIEVDDGSGLSTPATVWIGREAITVGSVTSGPPDVLNVTARGVAGWAHPISARSAGAIVTDRPRVWRGRLVTLYAQPCDATGYAPGVAWTSTSTAIWRGYIDAEPVRATDGTGWTIEALPLDRLLSRPLAAAVTGTVQDGDGRFLVSSDWITIAITRTQTSSGGGGAPGDGAQYVAQLTPFADAGYSYGDLISMTEALAAIKDAWDTWVSAQSLGAEFGTMVFGTVDKTPPYYTFPAVAAGDVVPYVELKHTGSPVYTYAIVTTWFGTTASKLLGKPGGSTTYTSGATKTAQLGVTLRGSVYAVGDADSGESLPSATLIPTIAVRFDDAALPTLPNGGRVRVGADEYRYATATPTTATGLMVLRNLQPVTPGAPALPAIGTTATVIAGNSGTLADCVRRLLHSSGEASLRGTYDTLPGFAGLGLPTDLVDDDAIGQMLGQGWWSLLEADVLTEDGSVSDAAGRALGLSGMALCVTDTYAEDAVLSVVYTSATATAPDVEIGDEHMITRGGAHAVAQTIEAPSVVRMTLADDGDAVTVRDLGRTAAEGARVAEYHLPVGDRQQALPGALAWAAQRVIGDQHASLVEIDVVPWLDARVGGTVELDLTHPALWDIDTGTPGISTVGRVVGRHVSLDTGVQRLLVLVDGTEIRKGICPAPAVSAYDHATAPTQIDISRDYLPIMVAAMAYADEQSDTLRLLHYQPGQGAEGTTEAFEISAVADTGSVCRLTVDSVVGSPTLGSTSYLTWPESANDDSFQATWMHDADGSRWA